MSPRTLATALIVMAMMPAPIHAEPIGEAAIARQTVHAWHDYKAGMQAGGWTRMQTNIGDCFKQLAARPSEVRAAYCIALDHLTLLSSMNFPDSLRPHYFETDTVFARMDHAVARTTPARDRAEFERRLLVTIQETIHRMK